MMKEPGDSKQTNIDVPLTSTEALQEASEALKRHDEVHTAELLQVNACLQAEIRERKRIEEALQQAHRETIERLVLAAEYRDQNTAAHIHRVRRYCGLLARLLDLPEQEVDLIMHASAMHDVGKLGIPDSILLNRGRLTEEEFEIMQQHTLIGGRILCNSSSPLLQAGETIALTHHEKWDGSGYPYGLKGTQIPLAARICTIADVFDALTTARPYKPAFTNAHAVAILQEGRGKHFDPTLLDLFLENMEQVKAIQLCYGEVDLEAA